MKISEEIFIPWVGVFFALAKNMKIVRFSLTNSVDKNQPFLPLDENKNNQKVKTEIAKAISNI